MPGSDRMNRVCWGVRVGSNTCISHLRAGRRAAPVSDAARRGHALQAPPPDTPGLVWPCGECPAADRAAAAARGFRAAALTALWHRPSTPPGAPRGRHQVELEVGLAVGAEGVHHAGLLLQQRAHAADPLPSVAQPALQPPLWVFPLVSTRGRHECCATGCQTLHRRWQTCEWWRLCQRQHRQPGMCRASHSQPSLLAHTG